MSAERERIEREATLIVYEFPPDRDPVQSIAALVMRERAAAFESAALLHEQVDVSDGRDPMAVVIEYRDRIRWLANG